MNNTEVKFRSKEDFVKFVKHAVRRKQEYKECRRNGATAAELEAKGFGTIKIC